MLRCGQAEDKIRSARGSFIRNSQQHAKIKGLSFFVVAVVTAMYVLLENRTSGQPQQSPPPMGNRNRPIVPSTVPAGPITHRGRAA